MTFTDRIKSAYNTIIGKNPYQTFNSGTLLLSKADLNVLSGYAFACINKRASALADIEQFITKNDVRVDNHFLSNVIFGRSVTTKLTWKEEKKLLSMWLDKTGNAYLWLPLDGGKYPTRRIFLPSINVKYVAGETALIDYYEVRLGNNVFRVPTNEMIHFKTLTAGKSLDENIYAGTPLIVNSIANAINADYEIFEYITRYFENNAIPPVIIKTNEELSEPQMDSFQSRWNSKFKNPPQTIFAGGGLEVSPFESKANELSSQVVNGSLTNEIMSRVCIGFGVTPTLLTGEFQNKSNAVEIEKQFIYNTIEPIASIFDDIITAHLQQYDDIVITHDLKEYKDTDELIKIYTLLGTFGWIKGNEVLKAFGISEDALPDAPPPAQELSFSGYKYINKFFILEKNLVESAEKKYKNEVVKVFQSLEKEVLKNLKSNKTKAIQKAEINYLFDVDFFKQKLIDSISDPLNENINDSLSKFLDDVGSNEPNENFISETGLTTKEVNLRMSDSISNVDKELRETIRKALDNNATLNQTEMLKIIETITKDKFTVYKGSRADLIAKETSQYVNETTKSNSASKLGLGLKWIHNASEMPRVNHVAMNGKAQDTQGYFTLNSGTKTKHPKGFGIAKEDIGCNCSTIAFKK